MSEYAYEQLAHHPRLIMAPGVRFYLNHLRGHGDHVAHSHNCLELAFILRGTARHLTVQGEVLCRAGEAIVIPLGAWHGYADCRGLEVVNCLLSPRLLEHELGWLREDPILGRWLDPVGGGEVARLSWGGRAWRDLRTCLESLEAAYQRSASRLELLGCLLPLLERLRRAQDAVAENVIGPKGEHPSVRRVRALMHERLEHSWTLPELASAARLNPSYLVRLFRSETGEPPMKYLARVRAERAANLLLGTSLRIGEIGLRVGWPDPKVFTRNFRQHFGVRARDYRERMLRHFATVAPPITLTGSADVTE